MGKDAMEVRWLGNSCIEILKDKHLVIDPNFKVAPQDGVDLVLVTHEHADHFDMDCYNQINAPIIAPRATLLEHRLTGVEARPGEDYNGIKVLESFCWKSKESVSYLTYGLLHSGDSAKLPDINGVKAIFTACFPGNYDDYMEGFKRIKPELVIPIHFSEDKKGDAIGLGERVKEAGMNFRLLEIGETVDI
jgi:L-ascorbate metabolism protein UlaG (beta-lactamase superfamily)